LAKIISIATSVPTYTCKQSELFPFFNAWYSKNETESRKLRFILNNSGIDKRHFAIKDLVQNDGSFYTQTDFPSIEKRMEVYNNEAYKLSCATIEKCVAGKIELSAITHLITVSCTGMAAPGLDLQIVETLGLEHNIERTSVNFMGCYGAIHGLKLAQGITAVNPKAKVIMVSTELCSLHFQTEPSIDNITAGVLFADGCAALLITADDNEEKGLMLTNFYSKIVPKGKTDMAWQLSSTGFLMTLTSYVSNLLELDFDTVLQEALQNAKLNFSDITNWCMHPGGKRILEALQNSSAIGKAALAHSYAVLKEYGNMSSPTILFVLQRHLNDLTNTNNTNAKVFGAAFGPGLTVETFIAKYA
jgi:predicted naringenin-chalcone synthase